MRYALTAVAASLLLTMLGIGSLCAAERFPVPVLTIYPGDVIRDGMLADREFPNAIAAGAYIEQRSGLVGKVAKRTLLPNQAIAINAVGDPRLVTIGATVRVVFAEGDLTISTYASALQAGGAGDLISVRNLESGLIIAGVIAADGSVHVSNGG